MEYSSDYELQLLNTVREYSQEEYDSLINAPQFVTINHLQILADKYPTIEEFRKEYCEKEIWKQEH